MKRFLIHVSTYWCGMGDTFRAVAEDETQLWDLAEELAYQNFQSYGLDEEIAEDQGYNPDEMSEEGIIMNSLLSEKAAKEVKNLHGKAVGYADHVCKECTKYKDNAIFLIGVDTKKSKKEPWRTGEIAAIKDSCSLALKVKPNIATLKDGTTYCFIDQNLGKELGLWK